MRQHLELAEHCIISYLDTVLNNKKLYYSPEPVCVISQWGTRDDRPRARRPAVLGRFPDVMWWDTSRWRSGRLRVWGEDD